MSILQQKLSNNEPGAVKAKMVAGLTKNLLRLRAEFTSYSDSAAAYREQGSEPQVRESLKNKYFTEVRLFVANRLIEDTDLLNNFNVNVPHLVATFFRENPPDFSWGWDKSVETSVIDRMVGYLEQFVDKQEPLDDGANDGLDDEMQHSFGFNPELGRLLDMDPSEIDLSTLTRLQDLLAAAKISVENEIDLRNKKNEAQEAFSRNRFRAIRFKSEYQLKAETEGIKPTTPITEGELLVMQEGLIDDRIKQGDRTSIELDRDIVNNRIFLTDLLTRALLQRIKTCLAIGKLEKFKIDLPKSRHGHKEFSEPFLYALGSDFNPELVRLKVNEILNQGEPGEHLAGAIVRAQPVEVDLEWMESQGNNFVMVSFKHS